jgi:hypothetical protein
MMFNKLIKPITDVVNNVVDKIAPDAGMAEKLKFEITAALINADDKALEQQAAVIIAEAQGESWLQRSWRPIAMLTFVGLIVAHWLGYTAPNLPPEQVIALLDIVKVGLGGYVLGRSAEKVMKEYKK